MPQCESCWSEEYLKDQTFSSYLSLSIEVGLLAKCLQERKLKFLLIKRLLRQFGISFFYLYSIRLFKIYSIMIEKL